MRTPRVVFFSFVLSFVVGSVVLAAGAQQPIDLSSLSPSARRPAAPPKAPDCSGAPPSRATDRQIVATLDACLQKRFATIDTVFGRGRIVYAPGPSDAVFAPKSDEEAAVYCALANRRADLAVFVVGRDAVGEEPSMRVFVSGATDTHWRIVREPIRVSGDYTNDKLPAAEELLKLARMTFAFGGLEHETGGWGVTTERVIASQQACVNCHAARTAPNGETTPLAVGDTLGVVLYVMRDR